MTISPQLHRHSSRPWSLAVIVMFIAAVVSATLLPLDAVDARGGGHGGGGHSSGGRSSGGYSRSSAHRSRTPSTASASVTDRALSRRAAARALEQFEAKPAQQRRPSLFTTPTATHSSSHPSGFTTAPRHRPPVELDIDLELPWFGGGATGNNSAGNGAVTTGSGAVVTAVSSAVATIGRIVLALVIGGIVLALVAALLYYFLHRRPAATTGTAAPSPAARPAWVRVGMILPHDPAVFILSALASRIQPPPTATSSGLLSVVRVSQVSGREDGLLWYRLYLTDEQHFFQIHLDASGQPDECRYFTLVDDITPSDTDEWQFWLDEHEGAIGWPDFQTKDKQHYERVWAPGHARLAPRQLTETVTTATDTLPVRRLRAMLYGRATGAAAPAPELEYLLVSAVKTPVAAWVAVYLGIDYPCTALALP